MPFGLFVPHIMAGACLGRIVGQITQARQAEAIIRSGQADMVALARGFLYDPHWVWHAADELRAQAAFAPQYARSHPSMQGLPIPGNPPTPK